MKNKRIINLEHRLGYHAKKSLGSASKLEADRHLRRYYLLNREYAKLTGRKYCYEPHESIFMRKND